MKYRKGTKVEWKWGSGTATGKVAESFTEEVERATPAAGSPRALGGRAAPGSAPKEAARPLPEVDAEGAQRQATGIGEFDRCLGGGLVAGSLVLLGGEPGIGKSTLLLQVEP